jgi:predicted 3-demethylubiquinone-9 3-methyltransferase (glyoxalase superfamily)
MSTLQKISPHLWFDRQAEEAARFYVSVFPNSRLGRKTHYGKAGFEIHGMPEGTVMNIEFELDGQKFIALNGGPHFTFNEAISFVVECADQREVDEYWEKLGSDGDDRAQQCGWLKDRFGVSWQIVPAGVIEMLQDPDLMRRERVMQALLEMKKLDLASLKMAYDGR